MWITINTSSLISSWNMNSDCSDLRITNTWSLLLDHWIENWCNTSSTNLWFRTDSIINWVNNFKLQYWNIWASSNQVSPSTLFTFYDNFDDNSLNTSYWQSANAAWWSISETNWKLRLYCAWDSDWATDIWRVQTVNNLTWNFKINYLWERDQTTSTSYWNYRYITSKYWTQNNFFWSVWTWNIPRQIQLVSNTFTSLPSFQSWSVVFSKSWNNLYSEFVSWNDSYSGTLNISMANSKFSISSECWDHWSTYANIIDNYKVMDYVYPEPVFVWIQ